MERRAKEGDLQAAIKWLAAVTRTGDIAAQHEAMLLVGQLQYPGLMKMVDDLKQAEERIQMPPVEGGYASTEIEVTDSTGQ